MRNSISWELVLFDLRSLVYPHPFYYLFSSFLPRELRLVGCGLSGDALNALRQALTDTSNVLQSWDPTLVNPCTWFHVTCNSDNNVIRV